MIIKSIYIKNGLLEKYVEFDKKVNLIFSTNNSQGKTTLVRFILYSLGYSIPSTKKLNFEKCFVKTELELDDDSKMILTRENGYSISVFYAENETNYILPEQLNELHSIIFNTDNKDVLNNILGSIYFDQEKGWTLLNRGVVIGSIHFNIDDLVRGISEKDCLDLIATEKRLSADLSKYRQMVSIAQYRDSVIEESLVQDSYIEDNNIEIEQLRMKYLSLEKELKRLNQSISGNRKFQEFVADMKLLVKTEDGSYITVTKDNIVGLNDSNDLLLAKKKMLLLELSKIVANIEKLKGQQEKEEKQISFYKSESLATTFDKKIVEIPINQIAIKKEIEKYEKELKLVRAQIVQISRSDTSVILSLYNNIVKYAQELGIGDSESVTQNYLFTSNLKELSGAVLHKTVFAFKMAYILEIEKYLGIKLPIILDSPSGKEIDQDNVNLMMNILKRDFKDNQIIIASIYEYSFRDINKIELTNLLLDSVINDA